MAKKGRNDCLYTNSSVSNFEVTLQCQERKESLYTVSKAPRNEPIQVADKMVHSRLSDTSSITVCGTVCEFGKSGDRSEICRSIAEGVC